MGGGALERGGARKNTSSNVGTLFFARQPARGLRTPKRNKSQGWTETQNGEKTQ